MLTQYYIVVAEQKYGREEGGGGEGGLRSSRLSTQSIRMQRSKIRGTKAPLAPSPPPRGSATLDTIATIDEVAMVTVTIQSGFGLGVSFRL